MKINLSKFLIIGFVYMISTTLAVADTGLSLDQIQLSQKIFDPAKGESLSLSFKSNQAGVATVTIYNFLGEKVSTPFSGNVKRGETCRLNWNGQDSAGKAGIPGVYYYTISLKTENDTMTYNPYPQTHGKLLTIHETGYDEKNNQFYVKLPQAAMVRIRVNLNHGGPIMATPLDWTPLAAGEYKFPWDGKDSSHLIDVKNNPQRNIMIFAYSLADNSIIVKGEAKIPDEPFAMLNESQMAKQEFPLNLSPDRYMHAVKDPRINHVARIDVTFPDAKFKDGVPMLSGKAPIRVSIDPRDQWVAEMSRYELMFYIDTVVIFEDESGFAPFTYYLNTKDLTAGEHILTVNLLTYDDHYAVMSKKIIINNEK